MNTATIKELDRLVLNDEQRRGNYAGLNFRQYRALVKKERKIAKSNEIQEIRLDEVIQDMERNGAQETQLLPKAFLTNTVEDLRKAYLFGHKGLVTHFAVGPYKINRNWQLGLISAHVPGGSGGGGWGLSGTRKLQLAINVSSGTFDPDLFIAHTLAWAYEDNDSTISYRSKNQGGYCDLLRIAIAGTKSTLLE